MSEIKNSSTENKKTTSFLVLVLGAAWAFFQLENPSDQFMLPLMKVAAVAFGALFWFLALGYRAEQKTVARLLEGTVRPLFGLASLAILAGFLFGKISEVFENLNSVLSL